MKTILWLLFMVVMAFADPHLLATEYDVQRGQSPSGAITYSTSGKRTNNSIWLEPSAKGKQRIELCSTPQSYVHLRFSPDERWLVLTTAMGSSLKHGLRLFKRGEGFTWREMKTGDIGGKLQALILKQCGLEKVHKLDLSLDAFCWSADSAVCLLCVHGEIDIGKENIYVNPWFCVYEVATGTIGFDMAKYNFDLNMANLRCATYPENGKR